MTCADVDFFFSSRRRHTRCSRDWSSDVCSSDLRSSRPTTSSECPSPYTAAVSIQLMPSSSACRMAARDAVSSCGPQPNDQPPPPIAQAPKPTVVISSPLVPSGRVGKLVVVIESKPLAWCALPELGPCVRCCNTSDWMQHETTDGG